ncbi:hypothetical protein AB3662_39660 [Sorangium cellulosum]|uniref:hypothetical protein n=1 Tax=Sorangium cellulosum TaxID=56 RepID=UPI003D9A96D2
MDRIILKLGSMAGAEVFAVCGKVGGFGKYGSVFGPLAGRLHLVVEEVRARSVYRFPASARSRTAARDAEAGATQGGANRARRARRHANF